MKPKCETFRAIRHQRVQNTWKMDKCGDNSRGVVHVWHNHVKNTGKAASSCVDEHDCHCVLHSTC
eukprot:11158201-Lingulodinium_polyedra.AAC.1